MLYFEIYWCKTMFVLCFIIWNCFIFVLFAKILYIFRQYLNVVEYAINAELVNVRNISVDYYVQWQMLRGSIPTNDYFRRTAKVVVSSATEKHMDGFS